MARLSQSATAAAIRGRGLASKEWSQGQSWIDRLRCLEVALVHKRGLCALLLLLHCSASRCSGVWWYPRPHDHRGSERTRRYARWGAALRSEWFRKFGARGSKWEGTGRTSSFRVGRVAVGRRPAPRAPRSRAKSANRDPERPGPPDPARVTVTAPHVYCLGHHCTLSSCLCTLLLPYDLMLRSAILLLSIHNQLN